MKLLMLAYGPGDSGHADYALLDLTEELARSLLERRSLAQQARAMDDQFLKLEFWAPHVTWLSDDCWDQARPEGAPGLWDIIDETLEKDEMNRLDSGYPVTVPDDFTVPEYFEQDTEVDILMVYLDDVYFSSYPRHCDAHQETAAIPFDLIEVAAGFRLPGVES
jgi:hypothetical protein